jgi:hypothetical protein
MQNIAAAVPVTESDRSDESSKSLNSEMLFGDVIFDMDNIEIE